MNILENEVEVANVSAPGIVVRTEWQRRVLTFLMVFGPGLIVM